MYIPLNLGSPKKSVSTTSTGAIKGVNLFQAPEFLKTDYCQKNENYIIEKEGELKKRGGSSLVFTVAGYNPISMLEEFTTDIWIFGYSNIVSAYTISTDTVTVIKNDFTTSDPFSGQRVGDYFFVCNGGDKIGRITRTLGYDAQTANFTAGLVVTGGTSGAKGVILEDADGGATGTLTLGDITGTFADNENITDTATGSATVNGTLIFTFTSVADAPKASVLFNFGNRIYAGNIEGNSSKIQWSRADNGSNPPFTDWTASATPPESGDASSLTFRNAGVFKSFASLGQQLVAFFDKGKAGFRIDTIDVSGVGLSQYTITDFQTIDFGGERGAIYTPKGIFYVNEAGIWQMISGGSTNQPFSEQSGNISRILGEDFIDSINFTDASIVFDAKRNIVMVSCRQNSDFNNLVIWYNIETKNFGTFKGWNIKRFFKVDTVIYASSSIETKVYKLFDGSDDDGVNIDTFLKQEVKFGALDDLIELVTTKIKGFFSSGSNIQVSFDIYDSDGILTEDYKTYTLISAGLQANAEGFNEFSFGDGFGGGVDSLNNIETRGAKRTRIREFTRLIMKIRSTDSFPHKFTWIALEGKIKGYNKRKNNLN
jgi:hypothetical protein